MCATEDLNIGIMWNPSILFTDQILGPPLGSEFDGGHGRLQPRRVQRRLREGPEAVHGAPEGSVASL